MSEKEERAKKAKRQRGIFERIPGSGVWWVRYADENGRIHREKVGPKALAVKVYQKRRTEIREGRFFPKQIRRREISITEAIDDYLARKENVLRHFRHYRRLGRYWKEAYGSRALGSIQPADVESYAARRVKQVAFATVNRELAFLKRIYYDAMANGKAESNPVKKVQLFKENNARVRYLTEEEEQRVRREMKDGDWHLILIALQTGLRQAEQFNLRWENVDFQNGLITVPRSKNGEVRRVPMNEEVRAVLRDLPSRVRNQCVFPNRNGNPKSADNFINRHFKPALQRARIENFRWHDLRHTFASRLVMKGVPLTTVKELMGHKTIQMTLRYAHLASSHLLEAVQKLT